MCCVLALSHWRDVVLFESYCIISILGFLLRFGIKTHSALRRFQQIHLISNHSRQTTFRDRVAGSFVFSDVTTLNHISLQLSLSKSNGGRSRSKEDLVVCTTMHCATKMWLNIKSWSSSDLSTHSHSYAGALRLWYLTTSLRPKTQVQAKQSRQLIG